MGDGEECGGGAGLGWEDPRRVPLGECEVCGLGILNTERKCYEAGVVRVEEMDCRALVLKDRTVGLSSNRDKTSVFRRPLQILPLMLPLHCYRHVRAGAIRDARYSENSEWKQ